MGNGGKDWHFDEHRANQAWEAHSTLVKAMIGNPELRDNPIWTMFRNEAYYLLQEAFGSIHE